MSELTKADLDAALLVLRNDIVTALSNVAQKVHKLEQKVEKLDQKLEKLDQKVDAHKDELMEFSRQIETNLLTEFHRYGKGQQIRLHSLETRDAGVIERLANIEERLLHLEARRPPAV